MRDWQDTQEIVLVLLAVWLICLCSIIGLIFYWLKECLMWFFKKAKEHWFFQEDYWKISVTLFIIGAVLWFFHPQSTWRSVHAEDVVTEVEDIVTWEERIAKIPCPHSTGGILVRRDLFFRVDLCYKDGGEEYSTYINGELAKMEFYINKELVDGIVYQEVYDKYLPVRPKEKISYEILRTDF